MGRDARRDVWVDRFRPVAASMVVAIHTGPLADVSPMLNKALVYGAFRVAVPFFLMVAARLVPVLASPAPLFSAALALSFAAAMGASHAAPAVGSAAAKALKAARGIIR